MKMLILFALLASNLLFSISHHTVAYVDPTGTYILKGDIKNNIITSPSGEIRVKSLGEDRLVMCFYINKGFPRYESAAFSDTLFYVENTARFCNSPDTACVVIFSFERRLVQVSQMYSDPQGCGFAKDINLSAVFQKHSADVPVIQDLSARGSLP